jgi:hypothetical protein
MAGETAPEAFELVFYESVKSEFGGEYEEEKVPIRSSNDVPMLNLVDVPIEIFEKMTLKTEAVDAGNLDHNWQCTYIDHNLKLLIFSNSFCQSLCI